MKTILVLSILFCVIALPALGELTDADLAQSHSIVENELVSIFLPAGSDTCYYQSLTNTL